MRHIGLATYTIRARPKRSDEYDQLGAIAGLYSLAELLAEYLASISSTQAVDEEAQLVLQAVRRKRNDATLWGLLRSGEYGYAADGFNVRSRRRSYRRTPEDAEVIPFYYRAHCPRQSDLGLLLLQRHGPHGVFTSFTRGFRAFFAERIPDHTLDINRLVPSAVMRHLLEGEIRAIQVVAHTLPTDITDKLRFLGNRREVGTYLLEAKAKRNGILPAPNWLERARLRRTHLVELPQELEESDARMRLRVEYEGTTRMIDLNNPTDLAPYTNITNDVTIDASGHPTFASIDRYAVGFVNELLQQLGHA